MAEVKAARLVEETVYMLALSLVEEIMMDCSLARVMVLQKEMVMDDLMGLNSANKTADVI